MTEGGQVVLGIDDAVISGPASATSVPAILHMVLDGNLTSSEPPSWKAQTSVQIICGSANASGYIQVYGSEEGAVVFTATGLLAEQAGPGAVSIPIDLDCGLLPVNSAFDIYIFMDATVGPNGGLNRGSAESNFFDGGGLHFPASGPFNADSSNHSAGAGPVFTLPPGYTVNIPSLNVVDNTWHGGTVSVQHHAWTAVKNLYR
jgi:hypothetical protein